ncbi:Zn-ribbon domain-containing OB-fold protein [Streptomyces ipomoeae]|uniref:Zn-ribbon domain-containing OB-fold protein n=1 Tax=Streptomyces ipomoeae TaxID=103232 RepID=UPI001146DC46|nr:hypothetical protein [Streptomyces ipomoeae]MDX2939467.1 hypothetical protein [Streptomyces ipomoeae]TQE17692.1 hypothetical protein SipoB123_36150 [Streptomyces ipomoeae]
MAQASIETADNAPGARGDDPAVARPADEDRPGPMPLREIWKGELYFQRCRWCRTAVFRCLLCPVCSSPDFDWERSSGIGAVSHLLGTGHGIRRSWSLAIVGLREGFSVRCKVIDVRPLTLRVGSMVNLAVEADSNSQELIFRLCSSPVPTDGKATLVGTV